MFRRYMREAGERALEAFPEALRPEIYVVSFRISHGEHSIVNDDLDYPYDPYLAIGFNTESEVRRALDGAPSADPGEVRWSYAHMLLEESGPIGHHPDDPAGTALYLDEVKEQGLWYDSGTDLTDEAQDELDEGLCEHFDAACIDLARHLHAGGRVAEVLGRPAPIVLFDMFRSIEVDATKAANPPDLVADYLGYQLA